MVHNRCSALFNYVYSRIILNENMRDVAETYLKLNIGFSKLAALTDHKQNKTPRTAKTIFIKETFLSFSEYKKIHGIAKAIWMGLETKFGINPEKIKYIWKMIDPRPIIIHIFLSTLINYDEKIFLRLFLCNILMHLGEF